MKYCCDCLKKGEETEVPEDQYKGGGVYYCEKCRGAVLTIAKTSLISTLLVEVDQSISVEIVAKKVVEMLPGATGGPNGLVNQFEIDINWTVSDALELIRGIPGVQATRFVSFPLAA